MFFGKSFMLRHVAFRRNEDIRAFLASRAPAHVYQSAAYYEKPNASTMKEKSWMGADLIFDLDADHIAGADLILKEKDGFEKILKLVKDQFVYLIEEFLLRDFGFSADELEIVFSGGRGYHIHITNAGIHKLGTHERREIVDYITGVGLELDQIFRPEAYLHKATPFQQKTYYKRNMPSRDAPGWKGRMARGVMRLADELERLGEKEAIKAITRLEGVGATTAERIYADLFEERGKTRGIDRLRDEGNFWIFTEDKHGEIFFELVKSTVNIPILLKEDKKEKQKFPHRSQNANEACKPPENADSPQKPLESFEKKKKSRKAKDKSAPSVVKTQSHAHAEVKLFETAIGGETDEPVTSDIKRLIRMPSSLHGKTGLRVVPLTIDELKGFEPLRDAVVFPDAPVKIEVIKPMQIRLKGENFSLTPGLADVPEYVAIYAMCRGCAFKC